jgi:hypothetical protein
MHVKLTNLRASHKIRPRFNTSGRPFQDIRPAGEAACRRALAIGAAARATPTGGPLRGSVWLAAVLPNRNK